MHKMKILLFVLIVLQLSVLNLQAADQPSFVGRYYLQGVREVGSELVLRADGTYAWMLAYGNQDHSSEGRWMRQGNTIVLSAAVPSATGPLIWFDTKQKMIPWSFEAEQALQKQRYLLQREQVLKDCPFMDTADYASAPKMIGEPEPTKQEREQRAAKALLELQVATKSLEKAAAEAVQQKTEAAMQKAVEAMDRFQAAWLSLKEANWDAGRPAPKRPVLQLPKICQMPNEPDVQQNQPAFWLRQGIGVTVRDHNSGSPVYRLPIRFVLTDGTKRAAVSSGAVSVVWLAAQEKAVALEVQMSSDRPEAVVLPLDAVSGSLCQVVVDTSRLVTPFFRELRLEIEANTLVWPATGGRYQR